MTRKQRELKRNLTQKEILAFGKEARVKILEKSRDGGIQAHQAIQNYNSRLPYELHEDYQSLFEAYFNWAKGKKIEPILEEFRVKNLDYGYAGRLDFYGKIDGRYVLMDFKATTVVDWSMGLQLAAYRRCLEDLGYQVDDMIILHLKPWVRGGIPYAEPHYFNTPFKAWEGLLTLFHTKLASMTQGDVEWYSRTDATAIEAEIKNPVSNETGPEVPQETGSRGLHTETVDTSPTRFEQAKRFAEEIELLDLRQADKQFLSQWTELPPSVEKKLTSHSTTQQVARADETSLHIQDSQPGKQPSAAPVSLEPGVVVRFSGAKPQIVPEPFELPSAKDISAPPELDSDTW